MSFPFRTISAFSAVSPPFESCEIDEQDQQQEHQQFHTSLPFRRVSVIALLVLSLSLCHYRESTLPGWLPHRQSNVFGLPIQQG